MRKITAPRFLLTTIVITAVIFASSCRKNAVTPNQQPIPKKATIELIGQRELKKNEFNSRASTVNGIDPNSIWSLLVSLVVDVYKVTYPTTDPDGNVVTASGLLVIPKTDNTLSLVSFQNGTLFDKSQAPSNFSESSQLSYWIPLAAAMGYIVVVPDYIGYGTTANLEHPYQHASSLASSTVDMIRAVKELVQDPSANLHAKWNNKLFLAGYSEGGYATMAAHRLLQEHYPTEFNVTAASYGAGAYDITQTATYFLSRNEVRDSFYIRSHVWVLLSFNRIYHENRPLNSFVNAPYDQELATHPVYAAQLPTNPAVLMNPVFKANVLSGRDTAVLRRLAENDVYDWTPRSPVLLQHADLDGYVPIFNSDQAYARFKSRGVNATYIIIHGKNHPEAIPDFALNTLQYFSHY
ncbi:MAG TPA: lipase family protein [Chitinophaga sp.]|uniref:alpha/beta hydrolase family protein n=1 Tax=Chitinophaga sp. TaxID=1869181 RepID=UPI002CE52514|nr:lipase family protein [Chitinophaga sp.]HVI47109.1 lipase family protein [Chitinophaga sp.]